MSHLLRELPTNNHKTGAEKDFPSAWPITWTVDTVAFPAVRDARNLAQQRTRTRWCDCVHGIETVGTGVFKDDVDKVGRRADITVVTAMVTLALFILLEQPLLSLSDTILVCFVEAPERLRSSAHEMYELLVDAYGSQLGEMLHK
jgi:hypothetical protein